MKKSIDMKKEKTCSMKLPVDLCREVKKIVHEKTGSKSLTGAVVYAMKQIVLAEEKKGG